ncbi:MAG TPA: hypothetical protein PK201_14055, partial [Accumulibacter sp.]|nr:hypothetical protein [Accumulibacter sp.]
HAEQRPGAEQRGLPGDLSLRDAAGYRAVSSPGWSSAAASVEGETDAADRLSAGGSDEDAPELADG